jgi:hypothetical protein
MHLTSRLAWAVAIAIVVAMPPLLRASHDFGCESKDRSLEIFHLYYHGDSDPEEPATNFKITDNRKVLPKGSVNRHQYSDGVFALEIRTTDALIFSVDARHDPHQDSTELGDAYIVEQGFVMSEGLLVPLDGVVLYCGVG